MVPSLLFSRVRPIAIISFALGVACTSTSLPPKPTESAVPPGSISSTSSRAPVASSAPSNTHSAPDIDPAREALWQELKALRKCGADAGFSCKTFELFSKPKPERATIAEEDLLFSTLENPDGLSRLAIIYRLANQRGPRDQDPKRKSSFLALAQKLTNLSAAETKWLGISLGSISLDTQESRDLVTKLIRDDSGNLGKSTLTGLGISHPKDIQVLDFIDSFRTDPRAAIRSGVIDAYAETAKRDTARACTVWASLMSDEANELRAASLVAVTQECFSFHTKALDLAEKRLQASPDSPFMGILPHLCANKATAVRAANIAKRIVTKVQRGMWNDPLLTIGKCDPQGPEKALAPYSSRSDDLGYAAKRAIQDILVERGERLPSLGHRYTLRHLE